MHFDAAQVARVVDGNERTGRRIIERIAATSPDEVTERLTGGRNAQVVTLAALAEHLHLDTDDVRILAGRR